MQLQPRTRVPRVQSSGEPDLTKQITLDFRNAEMAESNLGGLGGLAGLPFKENEMRFRNIATAADGRKIDLVIVSTSEHARRRKQNCRSNGFGQINLQTGTEATRASRWKTRARSAEDAPVTPERVDIALYDLDKGSARGYETESVTVGSSVAYTVPKGADLKITNAADTTTVEATKVGKDATPTDPFTLNEDARLATEAQQRVIMFSFSKVSPWDMTFKVTKALGSSQPSQLHVRGLRRVRTPGAPHRDEAAGEGRTPPATRLPPAKDEIPRRRGRRRRRTDAPGDEAAAGEGDAAGDEAAGEDVRDAAYRHAFGACGVHGRAALERSGEASPEDRKRSGQRDKYLAKYMYHPIRRRGRSI